MLGHRIGPTGVKYRLSPYFHTEPLSWDYITCEEKCVTPVLPWCRPTSMVSKSDVTPFLYHCFCSEDTEISCHPTSEVQMLENSCHPISIPPEIWLSPYFHTSILGHGLSPYFRGPGCHPTSVVLFLFSLWVTGNRVTGGTEIGLTLTTEVG